ncbi:MAG: DUF1508 domain-containing protein [Candidatus Curtissbacteria bacterium]|nr:DUF1508 domain-containing protein [Candidatus Curtissbacteria bacterium]
MMVRFEVFRDRAGYYRWRLVAANGEIVATGEGYDSKQGAARSAYRIKELAPIASVIEV